MVSPIATAFKMKLFEGHIFIFGDHCGSEGAGYREVSRPAKNERANSTAALHWTAPPPELEGPLILWGQRSATS